MQRLLTVAICVCAVGAVGYLHWPSAETLDAILPWGLGIVVGSMLVAVMSGEVARFLQLPRIFGYVILGLIVVPLHSGVLDPQPTVLLEPEVLFAKFAPLFAAALAVTGLAVGLRIDLRRLQSHLRSVLLHSVAHIGLVGATMFGLIWWFAPELNAERTGDGVFIIGLIALLTTTTSLTALYAVNTDLRADGRFPGLQIDIGLMKGALVVVAAITLFLVGISDIDLDGQVAYRTVAEEWSSYAVIAALSIGAGLTLHGALRWVTNQVVFVAISLALIVGIAFPHWEIAIFLGSFLAGVLVNNASRFAFQLEESLDRSNPFFLSVVFLFLFVDIEVSLRLSVWMFAVAAMAVRSVVMYGASRLVATRDATGGRHLPYSLFAQSLVALFAMRAVREFGDPELVVVEQVIAPLVVLDLLFGSLLHRIALIRSGFATEVDTEQDASQTVVRRAPRRSDASDFPELDDPRSMLPEPTFRDPNFRSDKLNRAVVRIRQRLFRAQDRLAHEYFGPRGDYVSYLLDEVADQLHEHVYDTFDELREVGDPMKRKLLIRRRRAHLENQILELYLSFGPSHEPGTLNVTVEEFLREVERACDTDKQLRAPEEAVTREENPSDDILVRVRKAFHAMNTRFGPRPMRVVPVRALALHHLLHGLPESLAPAIHLDGRFRIFVWQRVQHLFRDVDEMYLRTLEHLDQDVAEAGMETSLVQTDEEAAARESEELAEFDKRLLEVVVSTDDEPQIEEPVEPMLEEDESSSTVDPILAAWSQLMEELPTDLEDLRRDVFHFAADVRRRFALVVDNAYEELLHDLARAGTYALPARRIDPASRQASADRDLVELGQEIEHWRTIAMAFVDKHTMNLGFRELEYMLRKQLDSFVNQVETELCSHLTYYPAEISERCDDVVETLSDTIDAGVTDADLSDAFVQIRRNLSDFLQDEALRSVQEMRDTNLVSTLMRKFTDGLAEMVRSRRETYLVVDETFLDRPEAVSVSDVEPSEIPFQDIVDKFVVQATVASFNELSMRIGNVVDAVATGLGEVNRVISFNLDAAATELRTEEATNRELVSEFALGGIQRAGTSAAHLLEQVQGEIDGIDHDILELTVEHVRTVRAYLFDESMGRLRRLAVEVEKDRGKLQRRGFQLLGELRETASDTFDRVARPAMIAADLARERLSLEEHGRSEFVEDVGIATFEWNQLSDLPLAYRRLFTPTPVEIPELFVPREEQLETVERALGRWNDGRRASLIVTGDLGTGKTSFMHRVLAGKLSADKMLRWNVRDRITSERRLAIELCNLFGFRRSESLERIRGMLQDLDSPRVVVVDGIERLFLRTIDGNTAFDHFLSLVTQSPTSLLWFASCNARLWRYLDTMLGAGDYFTDHIAIERLDVDELEELIMRRHRVSGYDLEFRSDRTEALTPSRFVRGRPQRLQNRYFRRLHRATEGHPLLALYYWLASLEVSGDDTMVVKPLDALRTDYLHRLPDEKLIGLGQLVLHEELTQKNFAAVMRTDEDTARRDLALFESLNLVVREPGREFQYRVNQVLFHDVAQALESRNIT